MTLSIFIIVILSVILFIPGINTIWMRFLQGLSILGLVLLQTLMVFLLGVGMIGKEDLIFVLCPVLIAFIVWLFFRKNLPLGIIGGILSVLLILGLMTDGTFKFTLTFIEMPVQRAAFKSMEDEEPWNYKNVLYESVLIQNKPSDGEPLRDAMIRYFDEKMEEENPDLYTYRNIYFYIYDSETRVFIHNEMDPHNFARIRLDDIWNADLGRVWIDVNEERRIKCVEYRVSPGGDMYRSKMQTDTLSIETDVNVLTIYRNNLQN